MTQKVFYSKIRKPLTFTTTSKQGGEGVLLKSKSDPAICAKIYFEDKITENLHEKIRDMIGNPPIDIAKAINIGHSIAWPTDLLYLDQDLTIFSGYSMPYIDTSVYLESYKIFGQTDRIRNFGGKFTFKHLMITAYNLASIVARIHEKGHCIGDIRENNLFISPEALVSIIDCDSFQIMAKDSNRIYYSRVGTGEYLPPEMIGIDFSSENVGRHYADLFGIGVLIFKFLMNGAHPFASRGAPVENLTSTVEKIYQGYFAYEAKIPGLFPPVYAPSYLDTVPPDIGELFHRCFVSGHNNPKIRPTAEEWMRTLNNYLEK